MAETEERSLDDFFAKRDKKKRKEKSSRSAAAASSAANAGSNAAGGPAGAPRPTEGGGSGAAAASSAGGGSSAKAASKEEDDWKEFEQKEEIDYSGLRVQSMQISEKEDDESEKREEPTDSWEETGGGGGGVDRSSGPWNKSAPAPAPVIEPIVTETPEPVQTGGVYRPPGAREGGRPRRAQQGPPEIYSDTQFPSLQSTAKLVDSRKY